MLRQAYLRLGPGPTRSAGKYYEANLALEKAEEGWVVDSQNAVNYLADVPKYHKHDKRENQDNPNPPEDKPKS